MSDMPDLPGPATADLGTLAGIVDYDSVRPADMPALISAVHGLLGVLREPPEAVAEPKKPTPPVPIRRPVTDTHMISFEVGEPYRSLGRHLVGHGLPVADQREKWGLPDTHPMTAPAYTRQRSALARAIGLGAMHWKR